MINMKKNIINENIIILYKTCLVLGNNAGKERNLFTNNNLENLAH